ncbi:MAG: TIGR03960 family B12-binding radical SAM protein [Acidobacteriota bacterium]|nr:TIGR03960 family B12-binding radical SAM protein [Blastocatellia bacterium]MDW8411406.1 TIGR03960 family B12-binding radical SAM protein [Acidobacteriota bacterium]
MNTNAYRAALDTILPNVEKPVRYIGGEWNSVLKDPKAVKARIALCFPDVYEIGMSHLGLKILYKVLNEKDYIYAERAYAPWIDMEQALRSQKLPLASLETFTPLSQFDIVGFSLQYEMTYTNILTMLDLGDIPLHTADRSKSDPLVIGGGPCVFSPEPIADFFDLLLIGEGEELLVELIDLYIELKQRNLSRRQLLTELTKIEGVYAPSLYDSIPSPYHKLEIIAPQEAQQLPYPIVRRYVSNINKYPFPTDSPVPFTEIVHDRVAVEIARGCVDGCRFCQAGTIYRPVRERTPESIVDSILGGISNGGYDEASLTSLSTADYTCLTPVLKQLNKTLDPDRVSLSVSSLRASGITEDLSKEIAKVRTTGFTIAPEAGTQRMRDVINKNVTEEDVLRSCRIAFSYGWTQIKLYFMIGLPTETEEDVSGIAELGHKVRCLAQSLGVNAKVTVSVSSFVPKPQTPFQWCRMNSLQELYSKQELLRELCRRYKLSFKCHNAKLSQMECIMARGDRRLGRVIERAWLMGARFDGWDDQFNYDLWIEAMKLEGFDPQATLEELPIKAPDGSYVQLPWDHIDSLVEKRFLAVEYDKGVKAKIAPPCGFPIKIIDGRPTAIPPSIEDFEAVENKPLLCFNCGLACDLNAIRQDLLKAKQLNKAYKSSSNGFDQSLLEVVRSDIPTQLFQLKKNKRESQYRYRAEYAKLEQVKYLSHLDLTKALPRGFKRAGIHLCYSQGFHPMPIISYGPALSVGIVGEKEYLDFVSPDKLTQEDFLERINNVLPQGLMFTALVNLDDHSGSLTMINRAEYKVDLSAMQPLLGQTTADLIAKLEEFMAQEQVFFERARKNRSQKIDLRKFVKKLSFEKTASGKQLVMQIEISNNGSIKPTEVIAAVYGIDDAKLHALLQSRIRRSRLYYEKDGHIYSPLELCRLPIYST